MKKNKNTEEIAHPSKISECIEMALNGTTFSWLLML